MINTIIEQYKINSINENHSIISKEEVVRVVESREVVNLTINYAIEIVEEHLVISGTDYVTTKNFKLGTTQLFYNGLRETHYTEISNNQISLSFVPSIDGMTDELIIRYEVF